MYVINNIRPDTTTLGGLAKKYQTHNTIVLIDEWHADKPTRIK